MNIPARAESLVDRAAMSAAQGALLYLGGAATLDALSVDWLGLAGAAAGGALISLLTNVARDGLTGRVNNTEEN